MMSSILDWPADLPFEPLRDGFDLKERFTPNRVHETEQGPGRQRPSASALWAILSYRIEMTQDQFQKADDFLLRDLRQASMRFRMNVGRFYQPVETWSLKVCMILNGAYKFEPFGDRLVLVIPDLKVLDY